MNEIFLKIINMSISASWIILAVLILRILLKKSPKWIAVALWGIVGIRLLLPFSFESVLSLIPSAETIPTDITSSSQININSGITFVDDSVNGYLADNYYEGVTVPVDYSKLIINILAAIWLAGVVGLFIYTLISYGKIKHNVREALRIKEKVYICNKISSPFILGVISPKIYLPSHINEQDVEHVVAHEEAHLKRLDYIWKPWGFFLLSVHWFNPLVWLGYAILCRDIEVACDEKVVEKLDVQKRADYSQALLNCSVSRKMIAACPLAFGEVGVKARVKSVLNYKKPAFWVIVVAVILIATASICLLTNPKNEDTHLELNFKYPSYITYYRGMENYKDFRNRGGISQEYLENEQLFPHSFEYSDCEDFFFRYDEQIPLGEAFQVLFTMKFENRDDFIKETERVKDISFECSNYFPNIEFEAYATRLDSETYYEYALIDNENMRIYFIYLEQYLPYEQIEIKAEFIPLSYETLSVLGSVNDYNSKRNELKGDGYESITTEDEIRTESKVYEDSQLQAIVSYTGTMNELNKNYPTEYVRKVNDNYRISYCGASKIAVIVFDNEGNKIIGNIYNFTKTESDFKNISVGQALEEVQAIEPQAEYLFLYTGRNDTPRISHHYTRDGVIIEIEYDSSGIITSIRKNVI